MTTVNAHRRPAAARAPGADARRRAAFRSKITHDAHTHHPPDTDRKCRQCRIIPRAHPARPPRPTRGRRNAGARFPLTPGSRHSNDPRANTQDTSRDTHTASHGRRRRHSSPAPQFVSLSSVRSRVGVSYSNALDLHERARVEPRGASAGAQGAEDAPPAAPAAAPPNHRRGRGRCRRRLPRQARPSPPR